MNATGITYAKYREVEGKVDEWRLKAFMNAFESLVSDTTIKQSELIDYLYTKMINGTTV